jgi:hypothetical protein
MEAIFSSAGLMVTDSSRDGNCASDDEHVIAHPQRRQPGLLPQCEVDDGDAVGLFQRPHQQHVRLGGRGRRLEVVALVEIQRIDLVGRHEAGDLDLPGRIGRQLREVLVGEDHRAAVVTFVGLGDVGVLDDLAVQFAGPLVADPAAVLRVHLMEPDVLFGRGQRGAGPLSLGSWVWITGRGGGGWQAGIRRRSNWTGTGSR